jgi:putative membrane protein
MRLAWGGDTVAMPYRAWLLAVFLALLAVSAIAPHDRRDFNLEHAPTLAVIGFLVWIERRPHGRPLDDTNYTLLFVLALLHVIGAHWLYSRVPYDAWCDALFGVRPSDWIGATRNHYDRFVHLCFGLLATRPMLELVRRHVATTPGWAILVAVAFIGVLSKLYELAEWGIALLLNPEAAEAYNGQQGDPFDAHKDMALALGGALVVAACAWARPSRGASAPVTPRA